jgi:hypothetical protein
MLTGMYYDFCNLGTRVSPIMLVDCPAYRGDFNKLRTGTDDGYDFHHHIPWWHKTKGRSLSFMKVYLPLFSLDISNPQGLWVSQLPLCLLSVDPSQ